MKHSKRLITILLTAVIALGAGYLAGSSNTDQTTVDSATEEATMKTYEIPTGAAIPAVTELRVEADNKSGWNVYFETENFTFTPENASTEHIENQGHAHLHIDGIKVNRLYSNSYHVAELEPGAHTFSVFLNTNNHQEYVVNGAGTGAETVITQGE